MQASPDNSLNEFAQSISSETGSGRAVSLVANAWRRLRKNKLALFGLGVIVVMILIAIFGYTITPDGSPDADTHIDELSICKPGFSCQLLRFRKHDEANTTGFFRKMIFGEPNDYQYHAIADYSFEDNAIVWHEWNEGGAKGKEHRDLLAEVIYPVNEARPHRSDTASQTEVFYIIGSNVQQTRTWSQLRHEVLDNIHQQTFWLGTDQHGRDLLSRVLIGTRISLFVGLISVTISFLIGMLMGALAGFFRGWVDDLIMWFINVVWSIPTLLLVIAITLVLGKGMFPVFIAVGLTMWVDTARVVRGQILSIREKEFVEAGRALGFRNARIIIHHILPNVLGPVIVITAHNFASAILIEAGLSFLGIGAQRPTPSWGIMISDYRGYILVGDYFLALIPGLAIMILVMAFMFLGNGLRDAIDTKMGEQDKIMT